MVSGFDCHLLFYLAIHLTLSFQRTVPVQEADFPVRAFGFCRSIPAKQIAFQTVSFHVQRSRGALKMDLRPEAEQVKEKPLSNILTDLDSLTNDSVIATFSRERAQLL